MQGCAAGYAFATKIVIKCNIRAENSLKNLHQFVEEGDLIKKIQYDALQIHPFL